MYLNLLAEATRKGYSKGDLAKLIGIAYNTFWAKMNGITDFTISEIKVLCKEFDKPFEYLFEEMQAEKTA